LPERTNPITWTYDGDIVATSCQPHYPESFAVYAPRSTGCDLVALAGEDRRIAGPYVCDDPDIVDALAIVIVLSK